MADEREEGRRDEDELNPLVQPQNAGGSSVYSGLVFKFFFCSLGLWGYQKWNYIPRAVFVMICITQAGYQISVDCGCPYFDCAYYNKIQNKTHHNQTTEFLQTREMCFTIFSLAAFLSYSIFLVCLIASRSKDSAMMSPSKSMADVVDRKEITLLFFAFVIIMALYLSGMVLLFSAQFERNVIKDNLKPTYVMAAAVVLTHWASFNTCHVFAISSLSLGK